MTKHKLVTTFTVSSDQIEGTMHLKEYQCGNTYTTAPIGATYCPKCGDEL